MDERKEEAQAEVFKVVDEGEALKIPPELPLLLMEDMVIYPHTLVPLVVKDPRVAAAVVSHFNHSVPRIVFHVDARRLRPRLRAARRLFSPLQMANSISLDYYTPLTFFRQAN